MSRTHLTRHERLALAGATVRGAAAGTLRAIVAWLLDHLT